MGISVAFASLVFRALGGSASTPGIITFLFPFTLAALVHQLSNNLFVASFYSRLRGTPLIVTWLADIRDLLWPNLLSVSAAALLSILYVSVHPATVLLYLGALPVQRWALELYVQQRRIYDQAITSLVLAIDANFPQGAGHSQRVADLAGAIARRMRLPDSEVEEIALGALLHDVGMIGLTDVTEPSTPLDPSAGEVLRQHVTMGAEVAREFPRRGVGEIVLYHHENYDGTGYPQRLKGTRIPVGARIVAVAEAFDSMVSGGFPFSEKIPVSTASKSVRSQAGEAFDPEVVKAFSTVMESDWQVLVERWNAMSVSRNMSR
jgi:putative nucleotidyltransferase with HDIG domain